MSENPEPPLRPIGRELLTLYQKYVLGFDFYFIDKHSYALVTFFNAVFDQGLNKAVPWEWYWSPLRFVLIAALDAVLDEMMLRESWSLCLLPRDRVEREQGQIVDLLKRCVKKLESVPMDGRLCEVTRDALLFGVRNPLELDFGAYSQKAFSPNAIGIQFVLAGIAQRLKRSGRTASGILIDRQTQFNAAQRESYTIQSKKAAWFRKNVADREQYLAHPFLEGAREDMATLISHFPQEKMTVSDSTSSIGLQLTDTFLWIANRVIRNEAEVPAELRPLAYHILTTGIVDGISLAAMVGRWKAFEARLPHVDRIVPRGVVYES